MSSVGDELKSCVVGDCDELTMAFCQSPVVQNDDEENGIVVRDEMGVEEKVETGGGGDWDVMVQVSLEEDVECGEVDDLETFPPQRLSWFRRSSSFVATPHQDRMVLKELVDFVYLRGRWFRCTWHWR